MRVNNTTTFFLSIISFAFANLAVGQASSSQNYVMINTVKQAGILNEGMVPGLPVTTQGKSQTISYFDGLGRPLQTVVTQGSATQKDIIGGSEYDAFGRETKKYLPYADISNTINPGSYKPGWKTSQGTFYNGQLQGVDADAAPWSQSVLEASPLNRLLAQGAPGTVWQPNMSNAYDATKKTIQLKYEINTVADNVRLFNVDITTGAISSPGFYGAGQLFIKTSIDEHTGVTKEFTDKTGHMLLKQVYIDNDVLQTYYIYDDLDLLKAVIQPEGVAAIPATGAWTPDAIFKGKWMFQYSYDTRNRMITKIVPGAQVVYMMYDKWDRLVLTQDGNLRITNQWQFTKYDALNRPIITGVITDARTQAVIQASIDAASRYETVSTTASEGYTFNGSFPSSDSYTLTLYTLTHYDSYGVGSGFWGSGYGFRPGNGVNTYNSNPKGQVVCVQTKVLGTNTWLRNMIYYDDKYRPIYTVTDNSAGGQDRITRVLSFDGKLLQEYQSHSSNVYTTALVIKKTYSYDHADRVLMITHKIGTNEEITLAENSYNELGQLLTKKLHQSTTFTSPLQKLDYSYNIRGWLNGINKPYSSSAGYDQTDLFNFELHYNTTNLQGGVAQYNGNIAEQVWKGGYDEYVRGYKYGYDKANRLKTADYGFKYTNAYNSDVWDFSMRYNENIFVNENGIIKSGYDRNGNIKHLERMHGNFNRVDDMYYSNYDGNKLGKIDDNINGNLPVGFTDKNNGYNDYAYDANGNLTSDYNKGITSITYNHLNLPSLVDMGAIKGTIAYSYDAAGNKLQKTVTDKTVTPNKITITKYAGAFVYTNSYTSGTTPPAETLEFIGHEEGRIRPAKIDPVQPLTAANTKFIYDYFMKDHLGNTRMVLTTEQQTDMYAATQEPASAAKENQLFSNLSSTTITKPGGFDAVAANTKVSRVNGGATNTRIGPSIVLKVMAGDIISISTQAWYTGATQASPAGLTPIKDQLLSLLSAGIVGGGGTHGGSVPLADINTGGGGVLDDLLNSRTYNNTRPKAFLNWVIVDEEFKKVNSSFHMGAVQVPLITGATQKQPLTGPANMTVRRNGWLYVYVSNESNQDVYFDDLIIDHKRGPVVEMNAYYPFGLEIAGLNSKALGFGGAGNKYKFNRASELQSKEFSDGSGLELYDAHFRMYDLQIGRFMQPDALDGLSVSSSLYAFADNNPILLNDPFGLLSTKENPQVLQEVVVTAYKKKTYNNYLNIPYYSKADSKDFTNDNGLYSQRKDNNQPLLQGGESVWYKSHLRKLELNYQANKEWKTNSLTAVLLIGSPVLLGSAAGTATGNIIINVVRGKLQRNLAGGIADFINQKIVLGKSWGDVNYATVLTNTFLGGRNIVTSALYESSGSFLTLSVNHVGLNLNKAGLTDFATGAAGNLFSNAWGGFFQLAGVTGGSYVVEQAIGLQGSFFGNLIANTIQN